MKKILLTSALVAVLSSAATVGMLQFSGLLSSSKVQIEHLSTQPTRAASYSVGPDGELPSFTATAEKVVNAVVNIKSTSTFRSSGRNVDPEANMPELFREFFGPRFQDPRGSQPRVGTGSGVIISADGYIVTNNHVIADADDIEVTLHDNRNYKATVVGIDPSTDLALIRIKEKDLPSLPFVNSDEVRIGEWVLAVGNPFSLTSTVTAGIVSAKGRNINIVQDQFAVESFIQTDAAINPGNSGGALVNIDGGLIGINTAIASPTGSYSGYGFAVPANIVRKVVEDLMKHGSVQRGVLGVMIRSVDGNLAREKGLSVNSGAYVDSLLTNSAAGAAGVRRGDVITAVDGRRVNSTPELQESIARRRPGDRVQLTVLRDGKERQIAVTLNNARGNQEVASVSNTELFGQLGADFQNLDKETAKRLEISGGVVVKKLYPGKLRRQTQMREGFVITKVNGASVRSIDDLERQLENASGGVMLEGVYPDQPGTVYYAFGIDN